jgi:FKBP-type peptidyl-prolyl cis-trans isomerase FkpA
LQRINLNCCHYQRKIKEEQVLKKFNLRWIGLVALLPFLACNKDKSCKPKSVESEVPQIQSFAANNGINATAHSSGLYYEIIDPGTGVAPTANSKIVITYTGKLMNGNTFDEQTTPNTQAWPLSDLIKGWTIGIPLIKKGGRIKLIIPSSLAYGCEPYYSIPANSVLYFDVSLIDVQ